MAASFNKVFLMGNLTRDPELRYIPSGTAVASFTVASNRAYATQTGEKKEEVTFVRIVVWGRRAEVCGEYLSKGSPVFVEGRLRTRNWQTPEGQNRSTIEVIASNVQFLPKSGQSQKTGNASMKAPLPAPEEGDSIDIDDQSANESVSNKNEDEIPF